MALTLEQLRRLADKEGFRYFLDPSRPVLLAGVQGLVGKYQFVMALELEGRFLQFRTMNYLHCPANHPNVAAVLRLIAELDYQIRFVKYGWDPKDGEIVVYGDAWIMDGTLTQQQFGRLLGNYLPALDQSYRRFTKTVETGQDPGPMDIEELIKELPDGGGLLDQLRKILALKKEPQPDPDVV